jgi:hypothetical protein
VLICGSKILCGGLPKQGSDDFFLRSAGFKLLAGQWRYLNAERKARESLR